MLQLQERFVLDLFELQSFVMCMFLSVVPQTQIEDDCIITKMVIKISLLPISFNNDVLLKVKQNS